MYGRIIGIKQTLSEVCGAISAAETTIKEHIKLYYHNTNEEFITTLFYGHIKYRLREANLNKAIENAFLKDLKTAIRYHSIRDWDLDRKLHREAEGLIADIVLHNKKQEAKTGGDFGLVIVHPQISVSDDSLEIKKGQTSGLLCQAKLKYKSGKWNRFKGKQKAILPNYLDFTSLVLYSYLDEERSDLDSVAWKLCRGKSLSEIDTLLKKGDFGELLNTTEVIMLLGREQIGTKDQTLIDTVVSPSVRQYFEVKIYWPKDNDPKGTINIGMHQQQTTKEKVYVKQ